MLEERLFWIHPKPRWSILTVRTRIRTGGVDTTTFCQL